MLDAEDETIDISLYEVGNCNNEIKEELEIETNNNKDINLVNNEVFKLYFDTRVRSMMIPKPSSLFVKNYRNTIYFIDMYSLYYANIEQLNEIDSNDEFQLTNFKKLVTQDTPNHFISETMRESFFINSSDQITFFNEDLLIETKTSLSENNSKIKQIEKGTYFNNANIVFLFNKEQALLFDNRVC